MTLIDPRNAHQDALSSSSSSSKKRYDGDLQDDPLREKQNELHRLQEQLVGVQRITEHLQRLGGIRNDVSEVSIPSGNAAPPSSASTQADADADASIFVPLHDVAFVRGQIAAGDASSHTHSPITEVLVDADSILVEEASLKSSNGKISLPVSSVLERLSIQRTSLEQRLSNVRQEVVKMAQEYLAKHVGESLGTDHVQLDKDGQAINEEGLPFIDLTEPLQQADELHGRGVVLPFAPEQKSKEDRNAWMSSILDNLELEERDELVDDGDEAMRSSSDADSARSNSKHRRMSSAERPAPIKSVLKNAHTTSSDSGASTPQKFGASGFRKGFLNMNPHSPGAEHSSDPIEAIRFGGQPMNASTSSLGSAAEMIRHANEESSSGSEDRMSRSAELIAPNSGKKKKKTVRIQSPERIRQATSSSQPTSQPTNRVSFTQPLKQLKQDENVEQEAKQIVDLLGIDAIKGHPQYETIKAQMDAQNVQQLVPSSINDAPTSSKRKSGASEGPAVRKDVVERSSTATASRAHPPSKTTMPSAFKRGFLAKPHQPRPPMPPIPAAPQQTQGISALERATNNDEALSAQRVKQGLTPAVPHARPSKAFAEKLKARREQHDTKGVTAEVKHSAEQDLPARMSKVRFGEDGAGNVAVRVGTAATEATNAVQADVHAAEVDDVQMHPETEADDNGGHSDDDEQMMSSDEDELTAMGLRIRDEELDDEAVEALGYFTDEDMDEDPDVGFSAEDLVLPAFDSDAGEINNAALRHEYERMKATFEQRRKEQWANGMRGNGGDYDDDDDDDEAEVIHVGGEGQDLSLADGAGDVNGSQDANVSRFRRERLHRAMMGKRAVSRELQGASDGQQQDLSDMRMRNAGPGPSMLIPSLANVRFPKPLPDGRLPERANEIELDGKSDEEEDRLEDVMRARLAQRIDHAASAAKQDAKSQNVRDDERPPQVATAAASSNTKKPSLFKARMQKQ